MVFIIWRGLGFLVVVIPMACLVFTQLILDTVFGKTFYTTHQWTKAFGVALAGAALFALAYKLAKKPARIVIDKESGKEIKLVKKHDLFYIPMQYWSYLLLGLAAFMLIKSLVL